MGCNASTHEEDNRDPQLGKVRRHSKILKIKKARNVVILHPT